MFKDCIKDRLYPVIGALLVMILSFAVLYGGGSVGLSDNGDFRRVLLSNNLEYEDETDHYYLFKQNYKMKVEGDNFIAQAASVLETNKDCEIYTSPHFIFIKLSKLLNLIDNSISGRDIGHYNIAWLAGLYILLHAMAAFGIFTFFSDMNWKLKIAVLIMYLFVFCDAGYLLYFNSFYGEPLQYVSLMMLLSVGLLMYKNPTIPKAICFYISLYFFAGSKLANVPFSMIISLMAVVIMVLRKDIKFRRTVIISASVSLVLMLQLYISIPKWMQQDTTYQSVFFGIVKDSKDPASDLAELGVDPQYAVLANTNAYMDASEYPIDVGSDEFKRGFYDKVSKLDLVMYYAANPERLFAKLGTAIKNTAYIRPPNLGNMPDVKMTLTNRYSLWSNLRVMLKFMYSPFVIFSVFILLTLYIVLLDIFYVKRRRLEDPKKLYMMVGITVLILGLWINLILPIVANGEADLQKHMFLFIHCNDILFMTLVIGMFTMQKRTVIISLMSVAVVTASFYLRFPRATVEFGSYNGKPIVWEIAEKYDDGTKLLVTRDNIAEMPFDEDSNLWESSDLRIWLNREFIKSFNNDEMERIVPTENRIILPAENKTLAETGNHTHFWNFTREQVGGLSDTAYHYYLEDKIFIPTLDILENISVRGKSWVLCPYAANSYMERYMNSDGFIMHTDVANPRGVRVAVRIKD